MDWTHVSIYAMTRFATIILIALAAEFTLKLWADRLNLRSLSPRLPTAFKDHYSPARYKRSQAYLKAKTQLGWISSGVIAFFWLVFWFGGGFSALDAGLDRRGLPVLTEGVLFIGSLLTLNYIISLPFTVYHVFGIEARFGFNRTSLKTFMTDQIKFVALTMTIGVPLMTIVLALFNFGGPRAWLVCWVAVATYLVLLQFIAPKLILPLFNRYEPLPDGPLRRAIVDYAQKIQFTMKHIFVMDGSRRSSKSNAFFTGWGANKRIALFDTLITQLTVRELVAVLAHEMGHYKKGHILMGMALSLIQTAGLLFLFSLLMDYRPLYEAFGVEQPSVHTGLVFFSILLSPLALVAGIGTHWLSRRNEYQADRFAVSTAPHPEALISALVKLTVQNMGNLHPHRLYVTLYFSHPPVLQRIAAIEAVVPSSAGVDKKRQD